MSDQPVLHLVGVAFGVKNLFVSCLYVLAVHLDVLGTVSLGVQLNLKVFFFIFW